MCTGEHHDHPSGGTGGTSRRRFLTGAAAGLGSFLLAPALRPRAARASVPGAPGMTWLAGDLHCHTVLSHDVWTPTDGPSEEMYTWGWTAGEQILIAETRGLDFLAITDHDTVETLTRPDYTSSKLTLLPGYEHSLPGGHAGIFVPTASALPAIFPDPDRTPDGFARWVQQIHDVGGMTVLNHPFYGNESEGNTIAWGYDAATSMLMDAVEVWNISWAARHDTIRFADPDNHLSLRWWSEELLSQGRMPMVGGSDNHWRSTTAAQGVGQPTTWVLATDTSTTAILDAITSGRTTVSAQPPALGGAQLTITASVAGETFVVGDTVPALEPFELLVDVVNGDGSFLRIVTDEGEAAVVERVIGPDQQVQRRLTLTLRPGGWVRAELYVDPDYAMTALTSPIYASA